MKCNFTQRTYYVFGLLVGYVTQRLSAVDLVPLDNIIARNCLNQLTKPAINSTSNHQANILVGWTGCLYYEAMLPVFVAACAALGPQHNCYSFNSSIENPPPTLTDYALSSFVVDATRECVGVMPVGSPSLVVRFASEGTLPSGQVVQVASNPAGAWPIDDNTTAPQLANFMDSIWNMFNHPARRLNTHRHGANEMPGQLRP